MGGAGSLIRALLRIARSRLYFYWLQSARLKPCPDTCNSLRSQCGFVLLGILVEFHLAIFRAEIDGLALVLRSVQRACLINFHVANRIFGHSRSSCKFGWGGLKTRWLDSLRSPSPATAGSVARSPVGWLSARLLRKSRLKP